MEHGLQDQGPRGAEGRGHHGPGSEPFPEAPGQVSPWTLPPWDGKGAQTAVRQRSKEQSPRSHGEKLWGHGRKVPGALQRTQPVASRARPGSLQGGCLHRRQEGGSWLGCGRGGTIPLGSPLVVQRSKAPAVPGGQALPPAGGLHPHGLSPGLPALRPEFPHHHNASVRAGGRRDHPAPPWLVRKMT